MKQLTGLDAGFLYMETPTTYGHISSLSIYDKPAKRGEKPYEILRGRLEERLPILAPLRRRLVEVPFQMDHPWWIEDPDFDLDFHVRHIAVPGPGRERELADLVGRLISRPLDRSRPLWEAYVIEGLPKGGWAALIKMHHATVDGAAGTLMTLMLLDAEPGAPPPPMPEMPPTEAVPTPFEMVGRTMMSYASRPQRYFAAQNRMASDLFKIATNNAEQARAALGKVFRNPFADDSDESTRSGLTAPHTPFNKSISPHRRFAYRSFSLDDVKAVKNHFDVSVNDVVMALSGGALRRYLDRHEALTEQPLVAMVPVSIRTGEEEEMWTNRVSSIFSQLPTHLADPAERVRFAHEAMESAKENFELMPTESILDLTQFAAPALISEAANVLTRTHIADQMRPMSNVVVSNVPGPRDPLYMGSARLLHYYPVSTIAEGQGLNITVQSLEDKLDLGLVGCRELLPDLWHIIDDFEAELSDLVALTEAGSTPEAGAEAG